MNRYLIVVCLLAVAIAGERAWGHGFDLSLGKDSQNNTVVIIPSSESTFLNSSGVAVGPQNLFIDGFSGTPVSSGIFAGSYLVVHGFADAVNSWPAYVATYNILSPLYFSDGTTTGPAVVAGAGTSVAVTNRDAGALPGSVAGTLTLSGTSSFQAGYGVSLLDPHELGTFLFLAANSNQTYGEFGFSYEVSVTLTGTGQTLTTGPLVDVFATDIGSSGGFKTFAAQSQQNTASLDIYNAAIAIPDSCNSNGNGNYSDSTQLEPNASQRPRLHRRLWHGNRQQRHGGRRLRDHQRSGVCGHADLQQPDNELHACIRRQFVARHRAQ